MRRRIFILALTFALGPAAFADTIHLKNGRSIAADSVRQNGDKLEYDIGENTYAIPRSSVERVETGNSAVSSSAASSIEIPPPAVQSAIGSAVNPFSGPITPEALQQIERLNDPLALATALLAMARDEQKHGNLADAREHLERALELFPNDPALLAQYVFVLLQGEKAAVAIKFAEQACREAPDSPDVHALLGLAYFKDNRSREAVAEWKKSLQLKDDPQVRQLLAKAQRELAAEGDYRELASAHFSLRYEGQQTSQDFRKQLLNTLEGHYNDLVVELGVMPRDTVSVVLYTNQAFFDVTQTPAWTAALNDGKLRIPVEGLTSVSPGMSRILKHELAHSFISQASGGRCPHWLHEGIAQMVEPRSAASYKPALAKLYKENHALPLRSLDEGFMQLSAHDAGVAYAESLAITEYIRDTYGIASLTTILQRLNQGQTVDAAMRSAIHSDQQGLEDEFFQKLTHDYGN